MLTFWEILTLFERTEALEERVVALVKAGMWAREQFDGLEHEAATGNSLSGRDSAQLVIPKNLSSVLEVLSLRKK